MSPPNTTEPPCDASADLPDLVERCRDGDRSAWDSIVARYERLIYSIPLREGLDREQAADVAQETFAALIRNLDHIDDPQRLGAWLGTVARRITWRKRAGIEVIATDDIEIVLDDMSDESIDALWVYEAVQALEEPCRSLITALFFDPVGPSYHEVAVAIGRPVGSIGPLRARCLDRLRRILEEGGDGAS